MSEPLQEALRRSFVSLEKQREVWRSVLEECSPLMEALGNLAEQMSALTRVQLLDTPLPVFPQLEELLRVKLLQAADTVLQRLGENMCRLQSIRDSISNQTSALLQQYQQSSVDLTMLTERSATVPSLADMLQWIQDAERFYRQQFLQRKALLQTLRPDQLLLLESAPKRWKSLESPSADQQITDSLCRLSLFIHPQ
uniref:Chromosome 1 open reading frame 109 n=1 Tax=Nothobranchius rachovii TaxID=451742 RepID=A0A1A8QB86_9TELE